MHTKNSVLSKARHLKMSQSGAILRVVNICVGSCGGAAEGELQGQLWTQVATKEAAARIVGIAVPQLVAAIVSVNPLATERARAEQACHPCLRSYATTTIATCNFMCK